MVPTLIRLHTSSTRERERAINSDSRQTMENHSICLLQERPVPHRTGQMHGQLALHRITQPRSGSALTSRDSPLAFQSPVLHLPVSRGATSCILQTTDCHIRISRLLQKELSGRLSVQKADRFLPLIVETIE